MEEDLLTMCCVCKKIKIEEGDNLQWLSRADNSVLYDKLINKSEERISDGYCPDDLEKVREEFRNRRINLLLQ